MIEPTLKYISEPSLTFGSGQLTNYTHYHVVY